MIGKKMTLGALLNKTGKFRDTKNIKFIIPEFQRGYSWNQVQISEMFEDIVKAYDKQDIKGFSSMGVFYFFSNSLDKTRFEVIDGQQRLTTLLILLETLKKSLNENDIKHSLYDENKLRIIKGYSNKCDLEKTYKSFFDNFLNNHDDNTDEENREKGFENMWKNYAFFKENLDLEFPDYNEKLKLYDFLLNKLYFFPYVEENDDVKVDLFMKLNSRGRELSLTTLIKSYYYSVDNFKIQSNVLNNSGELVIAKFYELDIETKMFQGYLKDLKADLKEKALKDALASYFYLYSSLYIDEYQNKGKIINSNKELFIGFTKLIKGVFNKAIQLNETSSDESLKFLEKFLVDKQKYIDKYLSSCYLLNDPVCAKLNEIAIKIYSPILAWVDVNYPQPEYKESIKQLKEVVFMFLFARRLKWIYDNRFSFEYSRKTDQLMPNTLRSDEIAKKLIKRNLTVDGATSEIKGFIDENLIADVESYFNLPENIKKGSSKFTLPIDKYLPEFLELIKKYDININTNI